jgi:ectoine hydroxylase-related dioxygenase (phytanoyl-CoA dioxygenase family)
MKQAFYGAVEQTRAEDDIALHAEEIARQGYSIVPDLFSAEQLVQWREKIDHAYSQQEEEFGRAALADIQELDVCRAPLLYDFSFTAMAAHEKILAVMQRILGDWVILNLQNAVINRPATPHHQSAWHRDLPHQNFVISRPIALNALIAIDDFSSETGGTHILPFSHKNETLPSNAYIARNEMVCAMKAGSAVLFDAMIFHRAGANSSGGVRRAVNHLYTAPIIKQQYDFPRALGQHPDMTPAMAQLLGYTAQVPLNVVEWRRARAARKSGEGAA